MHTAYGIILCTYCISHEKAVDVLPPIPEVQTKGFTEATIVKYTRRMRVTAVYTLCFGFRSALSFFQLFFYHLVSPKACHAMTVSLLCLPAGSPRIRTTCENPLATSSGTRLRSRRATSASLASISSIWHAYSLLRVFFWFYIFVSFLVRVYSSFSRFIQKVCLMK